MVEVFVQQFLGKKKQFPDHLQLAQVSVWWVLVKILQAAWHRQANVSYQSVYFTSEIDIDAVIIHQIFAFTFFSLSSFVVACTVSTKRESDLS